MHGRSNGDIKSAATSMRNSEADARGASDARLIAELRVVGCGNS